MTTRDAFTAGKIRNRIGLKRYLMNRSSRLLLDFLFWFAKVSVEEIVLLLTLKKLRVGRGGVNLIPLCGFSKNICYRERVKPWFFETFDIIISHIFPENFAEIPQVVQKIWKFPPSIFNYFNRFFRIFCLFLVPKKQMTSAYQHVSI